MLIARTLGHLTDEESAGDHQRFLGLRVVGGGKTEDEARQRYYSALRPQQREPGKPTRCTPNNIMGAAASTPSTMSADTRDPSYQNYVNEGVAQQIAYSNRNKRAMMSEELLFFTKNDWLNYVGLVHRKRD